MSDGRYKYTLLLSSLPVHPVDLFSAKLPPVSRIQLDRRLALLDADDADDLARIERLLHWSKMKAMDDASIVKYGMSELEAIKNSFLREVVMWRLEMRTILTALRRRRDGADRMPDAYFYGFGNRLRFMSKHWREADFGIGHLMPWVGQANALIENDDSLALEKLLLEEVWRHYARIGQDHYFDFPAVVIYVLRWDVIYRWSSYDAEQALMRFDELVETGMADVSIEF